MSKKPIRQVSAPSRLQVGDFEMVSSAPSLALAGIVSRITGYREIRRGHYRQQEAASLVIPLIISFSDPFAIGLGRTPAHDDRQLSFAAGLFAGPVIIDSFGTSNCIQIDFTPLGARRFFQMPMDRLADRMVELEDVLGRDGKALQEQLGNETEWEMRFDLVRRFVQRRIADMSMPSSETVEAYSRIHQSGGRTPIAKIASRVGCSRKHLAHRFRADLGLGPKSIARIIRFNRALALSKAGETGWADIAVDCGFSDQAHLTREFQALSGASPTGRPA